ncbi:hypothetical protein JCM10213_003012 [Rhodosporidiobolus nylandii]
MLERILITGAHSTGKTTLAHALRDRLAAGDEDGRKWDLVGEVARKLMARDGWTRDDVHRLDWQEANLAEQLRVETAAAVPYIADRCLLDPAAYATLHHPENALLDTSAIRPLLDLYRNPRRTLIVHLLPVERFAHDDGVRSLTGSMEEWWSCSAMFGEILKKARVEWVEMGDEVEDLKERVERVLSWMREREA